MNKDQIKGQAKQAKGEVKELAGKLVGDKTMETKGMVQKAWFKKPPEKYRAPMAMPRTR